MTDPLVIWLGPSCDSCRGNEREWSADDVFDRCDECGAPPVKYILAPDQLPAAEPPQDDE